MGKFWQGLLWGGIAGTVLWAVMNPMSKQYRKPLEQSADMARDTAQDFIRGARRARKRIIKRMD